ncbi:collagen alpha-1(I) chain-like [Vidua macroura]|uniref:collagen alpha-1(I) chain-like n=1 Tax=Vidua macroura TaxID=187451 RepID=UPI0023A89741|nr:collagen alpha-1(I) chain-like [Vidua macroura]
MTGRPSAAPPGARSRRCFGGHRAGAAGTCTAVRAGRARGTLPPRPQRAAGGGDGEGCAASSPSPPPRQDSAGSAEQPFSAAASPPELSRAAGPGGGTAQGTPAPLPSAGTGGPEPGRAGPGVAGLRRRARRDNPTLSPPFCYRAGVFPKQRLSGSLGNGPPLCRGGRPPRPVSPFPPTPAAPHLAAGLVPGRAATAGTFPPGSPRAPRPQHPRVVTARIRAGPCHAGLAPSPGPLAPRGGCRCAVPGFPSRWTGDGGAGHRLPPSPWAAQVPWRPRGQSHRGGSAAGPCRPAQHPSALPGLGGGPGSPRDRPRLPRGKPVGTVVGPREAGHPVGAYGMARPPRRVAGEPEGGGRDEPRDSPGGAGTGGQDSECPDGGGRSLHPRGVDERRVDTSRRTPPGGARPSPTAAFPARGRRSDVTIRGGPRCGGDGCSVRVGAERGGAGACPGLGLRSRAAAEGGERAGKEGAPAVLQCSAAPSPPARPRSAARHCGNADGSPARAGPNRSGHPLPGRAAPCPTRAGLPLSPASSAPFRFPPAPAGTAGRFLPRRDAAGLCPQDGPLALCLGARRDPHPASGAERRRTPPAATLGAPSSTPTSLCVSPRRRDLRSPRCCTHSGRIPGLCPAPFQFLPGESPSSLPILPHGLCVPISFSLSPLTPLLSPAAISAAGPHAGWGVPPRLRFPAAAIRHSESQHRGRSWEHPVSGSPAPQPPLPPFPRCPCVVMCGQSPVPQLPLAPRERRCPPRSFAGNSSASAECVRGQSDP